MQNGQILWQMLCKTPDIRVGGENVLGQSLPQPVDDYT
jgi:hypothetical protein